MSAVPYQAYKSKRHSRSGSATQSITGQSPPSSSSVNADTPKLIRKPAEIVTPAPEDTLEPKSSASTYERSLPNTPASTSEITIEVSPSTEERTSTEVSPQAGPSTPSSPSHPPQTKRASTFRRIPARSPVPPSPLRNSTNTESSSSPTSPDVPSFATQKARPGPIETHSPTPVIAKDSSTKTLLLPPRSSSLAPSTPRNHSPLRSATSPTPSAKSPRNTPLPPTPSATPPPPRSAGSAPGHRPTLSASSTTSFTTTRATASAPYRPGFQPKGVYRIHTDDFLAVRKEARSAGRVEREKLERRLIKLINLHFPSPTSRAAEKRPALTEKRSSSIFELDLEKLKNKDVKELWKDVLQSQVTPGSKADIRDTEQRITPWEEDSSVSKCPICLAAFHPLTNRKHHCRLCGQIICALPVKKPQRPATCSILFISDENSRIEEVGEGVHYGVSRKSGPGGEEKFLKGVRVCRNCRPVLMRQQYRQDMIAMPLFARIYEAFVSLEKEIEDDLPQFQELLLSLSNDDAPSKEASAMRKRLLEAFAQYDALAKRIQKIPTSGPGSSEARVHKAIQSRANNFLQKNMFPLQAIPKARSKGHKVNGKEATGLIDATPDLAHMLQPLLEQEALLEGFVLEANAHRKFEDAKTLKENLEDIRKEIARLVSENGQI